MSTKHTPGPWMTAGNMVYTLMHSGWRKGIEQFKNRFSALVQGDRDCSQAELLANARLIAAAPELLEALKGLLLAYNDPGNEGHTHDEKVKAAVAAIAKATRAETP